MPWKGIKVAQMREEFVKEVLSGAKTKAALCREYGISRPTGDKWIARQPDATDLLYGCRTARVSTMLASTRSFEIFSITGQPLS